MFESLLEKALSLAGESKRGKKGTQTRSVNFMAADLKFLVTEKADHLLVLIKVCADCCHFEMLCV